MLRRTEEQGAHADLKKIEAEIEIEAWLESALRGTMAVAVLAGDPQSARTLKEIYNRFFCMTHGRKRGENYAQ